MDVKQSWGFISASLGVISLLWGAVSLSGIVGQEHVFTEMGSFLTMTGSDLYNSTYTENMLAAERHKNFIVLLAGIVMAIIGSLLMRMRLFKF
ncbi:molybdenum cofactor biosynthesis protein [Photobacterium sp. NCIMB 13483]|uniref:Molybdenum cofactor biosynthesis protein n=1 Tax=Photobacterium piscicola TaxID=1378299 RepID=A0A1T5HV08_9GAMM|nr:MULTISPECIES: molybdenum cofactor biosynthesis protein [Photobacterium]PST93254.1 molybdenum cofactor biosynthesis protein [Photobacterium sp. NCIMB 13483]SKC30654.1 hypothetical protein CZ809_00130 [Photobacterium piscicola]